MHVVQAGGSLAVESGGIAAACASLANHLARAGVDVTAVTVDARDLSGRTWPLEPSIEHVVCRPAPPRRLGYCPGLAARLDAGRRTDVVHLHGLWRLHYAQVERYARRQAAAFVVSPHGMVHAPALRQRGGLKRAARVMFQDDVLRRARCLHATAQEEVDEIRRYGYGGPIALVPWGVDVPLTYPASRPARATERAFGYLGRFHPSKGLDTLMRAWAGVAGHRSRWRLTLAGYDDARYRATLETLARELNVRDRVTFSGPVEDAQREAFFAGVDVIVLPSPAENFGFVVPEALVRGVPVITTHGTPWSAVAAERCGWWVPATDDGLESALIEAGDCTPETLDAMGQRGMHFARSRFDWDRVTERMMTLYAWMRGTADRPEYVQVRA